MSRKILVRTPNWLGDAIMCTPFLKNLRRLNPDDRISLLCPESLKELLAGFSAVDEVLPFDRKKPLSELAQELKSRDFDKAYTLAGSFSSAFLLWKAGIPERIGYAQDGRSLLLTQAFPLEERYHYVRRYLGLLGLESHTVASQDFYFPPGAAALDGEGPLIAVAPGSQAEARRWMPEKFAALIQKILDGGKARVVLLGSPSDGVWAHSIAQRVRGPVQNLCGQTPLPILGAILKSAAALVTNESGMMHVAWAVGTPTVVVAGPSNPRLTSPFGAQVRVLQHTEVPCVPCVRNQCYRVGFGFMECMKKIEVDEVWEAVEPLLKEKAPI